jgi:hypothetical protein
VLLQAKGSLLGLAGLPRGQVQMLHSRIGHFEARFALNPIAQLI